MARSRRQAAAPETGGLADILSSVSKIYTEVEPMGAGVWIPDEGTYEAVRCGFKEEVRQADDDSNYGWFRVGLRITSGDEKVRGRETGIVFNTLANDKGERYGLRKLKGLTSVLNEGEEVNDLASAVKYIRDCCEAETPVQFEVDSYTGRDGKPRKGVQIREALLDTEPAEAAEPAAAVPA